jgi:hypothetical protein
LVHAHHPSKITNGATQAKEWPTPKKVEKKKKPDEILSWAVAA